MSEFDKKISQLTGGAASQATDEYVINRGGANFKITGANVAAAATSVGTLSSLTVSGDLTVDTSTLKVDSANNRVGIGTATPLVALDVRGSGRFDGFDSGYYNENILALGNATNDPKIGLASVSGYRWNIRIKDAGGSGAGNFTVRYEEGSLDALTIDRGGNLGLGVTPSAWATAGSYSALQVGGSSLYGRAAASNELYISSNAFYDGAWKYIYAAEATRYEQVSGAHKWFSYASGSAGAAVSGGAGQAMTLDASGNLGVGTTSPTNYGAGYRTIAVNGTSSGVFEIRANDTVRGLIVGDATDLQIQASGATPMRFFTNANERARITSGGYFKASDAGTYFGSTGAYHELRSSDGSQPSSIISNTNSSTPNTLYLRFTAAAPNNATQYFVRCEDTGAIRAEIRSNGGLANYQASNVDLSDARTKTDITPLDSMWGKVAALEIVSYKYIDQTHDDVNLGVIAQQVETVEPVWVDTDGFGDTPEGEEPFKSVYNKDITFAAIKALQEAMARIEALEARLEALEA